MSAWLAWRIKLPSILILIIVGILAGPYFGWLNPQELFGHLLRPVISLSVAIILFEGGLSLNVAELKKIGKAVRGLLTTGAIITWLLTTLAAHFLLQMNWMLATLVGAILVVTGPTVITPMMRQIRPKGSVASVLKWEGIVIDPLGVMLAVLVFELIIIREGVEVPFVIILTLLKTAVYGMCLGYLTAWLITKIYKKNLVPHYLQNAFTLMMVLMGFSVANHFQAESGLLTVTVMGIFLASQKDVAIDHIVEFKENLQLLLIPSLFIILSSNIRMDDILSITRNHLFFVGVLIVAIRPLSVFAATRGSNLSFREKVFVGWVAPRGIVAAAMTSVFAMQLTQFEFENAQVLVPTIFTVILGTVAVYGITSGPLAYALKLADPNPQGVLILGGHAWALQIAGILADHKVKTLVVDTNPENIKLAREAALVAQQINVLTEAADEELDLSGIGRLFALTPNEQVNSMAALRLAPYLGKNRVYQLSSEEKRSAKTRELSSELRGRILFSSGMTFDYVTKILNTGSQIKTKKFTQSEVTESGQIDQPLTLPLFLIAPSGRVRVFAADNAPKPREDEVLVYIEQNTA